jgi:hypothetical protein
MLQIDRDDLLAIDYVFGASFFHDHNEDAHYLVISANLKPEFREKIIQEVFHTLNSIEMDKMYELSRTHESVEQFM